MIRDGLSTALKDAMRGKDETATTTIRMINAAIKQKDIDVARARGDERIADEEVLNLLQGLIKSRRESIELYRQGNRPDLVDKEQSEIAIIERFLPKQLDEAAIEAAVKGLADEVGATGIKDMGKIMAGLKAKYAGQMDMAKAGAIVKRTLGWK